LTPKEDEREQKPAAADRKTRRRLARRRAAGRRGRIGSVRPRLPSTCKPKRCAYSQQRIPLRFTRDGRGRALGHPSRCGRPRSSPSARRRGSSRRRRSRSGGWGSPASRSDCSSCVGVSGCRGFATCRDRVLRRFWFALYNIALNEAERASMRGRRRCLSTSAHPHRRPCRDRLREGFPPRSWPAARSRSPERP
jgi:hypothetical protein